MSTVTLLDTTRNPMILPLVAGKVPAGFPSPAAEYLGDTLDLNEYLVRNPSTTFFVRVDGESMRDAGIHAGDIAVVDRSITPKDSDIVIAVLDGEFTIKRLRKNPLRLCPDNPNYSDILIKEGSELIIWGKVTFVISKT